MAEQLCQIFLDNQWSTYYAGQVITGHVRINLRKEKRVRAITLKFLGEAKTSWSDSESYTDAHGKRQTRTLWFKGHEIYLDTKQYLLGTKNGSGIALLPGEYVYPFSCVVPPTAPCSFEGSLGYVRYIAKVVLDRPWRFDQGAKMAFTVIYPLDLNHNQLLRQPVNLTLEKTFCCCFCRSGPLTVTIQLPSTGYVPGQIVPIFVDIDNASNVEVERLRISLRQTVSFEATSPRRSLRKVANVISVASIGAVSMRSTKQQTISLSVPSTPPSHLTNCTLIDLDYDVKIEACVSPLHVNLEGKIPVIIGTVPLMMAAQPNVSAPVQPSAPQAEPPAQMSWYHDPSAPPPSYDECMFRANFADNTDSEHIQLANSQFAPRYPNFPMTQPIPASKPPMVQNDAERF